MERNNNFNRVEELLQRFMDGQTTLDEERELERFFRQARLLPENLQPYGEMFACFDNGLKLPGETTGRSGRRKTLWRTVAAAAIVAAVAGGCWLHGHHQPVTPVAPQKPVPAVAEHKKIDADPGPPLADNKEQTAQAVKQVGRRSHSGRPAHGTLHPVEKGGEGPEPVLNAERHENVQKVSPPIPQTEELMPSAASLPVSEEARRALEELERAQRETQQVCRKVRFTQAEMLDAMMGAEGYSCVRTEDGGVVYEKENDKPKYVEL